MKKLFLLLVMLPLLISCSSSTISKIQWQGELVNKNEDVNYVYWKDGNQFLTQTIDSVTVIVAGFEFENAIYILLSLNNHKNYPITFFTRQTKLSYTFQNEKVSLPSIRPKNLDKSHFSFFSTVVGGAGRISSLFLNLPVDLLLGPSDKNEPDTPDKIGDEYHDESNMTKKLFMDNHTLFPESDYAGFLVFEYDSKKDIKEDTFVFELTIGSEFFTATGSLTN